MSEHGIGDPLLADAIGVRLFPVPPEGFDPLEANNDQLLRYGFPPRPATQYSDLDETWIGLVSPPMSAIRPKFCSVPWYRQPHGEARRRLRPIGSSGIEPAFYTLVTCPPKISCYRWPCTAPRCATPPRGVILPSPSLSCARLPPDRAPELCAHGQHRNAASVAVHGLPDRRKNQLLLPAAD
jgi:hypothetical protein